MSDIKDLIYRLRERAKDCIGWEIDPKRKSVEERKSDRISDLLEEAADAIEGMIDAEFKQVMARDWLLKRQVMTDEILAALDSADYKQRTFGWPREL